MNELEDLQILDMKLSDVAQVQEIARQLNLSNWSDEDYQCEIGRNYSITKVGKIKEMVVAFIVARLIKYQTSYNLFSENIGYEENCDAVNFDVKEIDVDIEIYNISVVKQLQNRGIGVKLLETLYEIGIRHKSAKIWLEVRESNTNAINFYKANNFEICYQRKNFYVNPNENGLVMKLEIN